MNTHTVIKILGDKKISSANSHLVIVKAINNLIGDEAKYINSSMTGYQIQEHIESLDDETKLRLYDTSVITAEEANSMSYMLNEIDKAYGYNGKLHANSKEMLVSGIVTVFTVIIVTCAMLYHYNMNQVDSVIDSKLLTVLTSLVDEAKSNSDIQSIIHDELPNVLDYDEGIPSEEFEPAIIPSE